MAVDWDERSREIAPETCPLCGEAGRALFTSIECCNYECKNYCEALQRELVSEWSRFLGVKYANAKKVLEEETNPQHISLDEALLDYLDDEPTQPGIAGHVIPWVTNWGGLDKDD
jgi:hypothetical protein